MEIQMKSALVAFALLIGSSTVYADSGVESLSPEVRSLLAKEMQALQEGMQSIFPAYVSGDLVKVAKIAKQMKNSYILKQSLTPDQKHELKEKLPERFLHSDQKFHDYAGMLAHVSEEKNLELVGFYLSKITESCVSCHREFAQHRFPGLRDKSANDHDHH